MQSRGRSMLNNLVRQGDAIVDDGQAVGWDYTGVEKIIADCLGNADDFGKAMPQ